MTHTIDLRNEPPRVVLADPDVLARNLLRLVCAQHGFHVVAETPRAGDLAALCSEERPDVAVVAGTLADGPVERCLDALVGAGARVVVMTDDPSPERLTTLLERGVSGYLSRDVPPDQVVDAIRAVAAGAAALHPIAAGTILQQWRALRSGSTSGLAPRTALTPREYDVLAAMVEGMATKAVARHLGVAVKTVENHKIRIFAKLGVRTQAHAVSVAIGLGLVAPPERSGLAEAPA